MEAIQFNDNPNYQPVFTSTVADTTFYQPIGDTQYHNSRLVACGALNIYASSGVSPVIMDKILDKMEEAVNAGKTVDVAVWINNLRHRKRYPVDEDVALRMAAIFFFIPGEDPNKTENHWTERKVAIMKQDPEAFSFFLPVGIASTPAYDALAGEISQNYFQMRAMELQRLESAQ